MVIEIGVIAGFGLSLGFAIGRNLYKSALQNYQAGSRENVREYSDIHEPEKHITDSQNQRGV